MHKAILNEIIEACYINGTYKKPDGGEIQNWFDKFKALSNPKWARILAKVLLSQVPCDKVDFFVAIPDGAIPIVVLLSEYSDIPYVICRGLAKNHGLQRVIEGEQNLKSKNFLIIEDVFYSGSGSMGAINEITNRGGNITGVMTLCKRQNGGGEKILRQKNIPLEYLFYEDNGDLLLNIGIQI